MNLEGKAGIVTGAGRGIGRGIALLMAREGASVIVNDPGAGRNGEVTTERPADEVVAEITKAGGKALANYDSVANYAQRRPHGAPVRGHVRQDRFRRQRGRRAARAHDLEHDRGRFRRRHLRAPQGHMEHVATTPSS